jgi:hypothetical protein
MATGARDSAEEVVGMPRMGMESTSIGGVMKRCAMVGVAAAIMIMVGGVEATTGLGAQCGYSQDAPRIAHFQMTASPRT